MVTLLSKEKNPAIQVTVTIILRVNAKKSYIKLFSIPRISIQN